MGLQISLIDYVKEKPTCPPTRHKGVEENESTPPPTLKFGTRWRCFVSFTPQLFYTQEDVFVADRTEGWVGSTAGLDELEER
jgi:hypothetical protein